MAKLSISFLILCVLIGFGQGIVRGLVGRLPPDGGTALSSFGSNPSAPLRVSPASPLQSHIAKGE